MRTSERGQVLPMWIAGILTTFALMFFALNYANAIRWQIRAQNSADSAAQAITSIQSQRWNLMTTTLYAANVEEFRIRLLLDAMMLSVNTTGGCTYAKGDPYRSKYNNKGTCNRNYIDLRDHYLRAVNRYGTDVKYLNDVAGLATYTNWTTDAASLLTHLNSSSACNVATVTSATVKSAGGDCAFKYSFAPTGIAQRTGLAAVEEDAQGVLVPGIGHYGTAGTDTENKELFAPISVDVVTCSKVPPIIPNFGPIAFKPYFAVGRAAATNVMVEQDWLQPGALTDPARTGGSFQFQGAESITQPAATNPTSGAPYDYDWYNVGYGGNTATAYKAYQVFGEPTLRNELGVFVGWWGAIPIQPFGGPVNVAQAC